MYKKVAFRFAIVAGSGLLLVPLLLAFATGLVVSGIVTLDDLIWPDPGDGLGELVGEEWHAGNAALQNARLDCGDELNNILRRNFRVVEVQLQPGFCPLDDVPAYKAKVQAYTFFMIPTDKFFVQCGRTTMVGR